MGIYTYGIENENFEERSREFICSYFSDKEWISCDTETTGKNPHKDKIISLQLGDGENQFFIDCRRKDILEFKGFLENKKLIFQNAKFDYKMLKAAGIYIEHIYDTMLMEVMLYTGYEKWGYGLDRLIERYCGKTISKEERKGFTSQGERSFTKSQVEYGATDVLYLHEIKEKQEKRITELGLDYCANIENNAVKALADIEYNGMILNKEKWLAIALKNKQEAKSIGEQLDEIILTDEKLSKKYKPKAIQGDLFGYVSRELNINYASPIQILELIKTLGIYIENTNERELTKVKKKHQFIEKLLELREKNKIVSTYGESFLNYIQPETGKVHTSFWQIKDTGRVSSGDKKDNAPNLQNLPAKNEFRNCFEARPGFKWVSIDYSGQELRLMADASGEQGFIDVLNSGEDLHCYAGSMMFKTIITKEDKELRGKAKTINFGKPYGMGPEKLADTLGISLEEAKELFDIYAKTFPTLNKWLENQGKLAKRLGYSTTFSPCKRRRWYPDMEIAKELRKTVQRGDKETWKKILTIEGQTERNGGNSPIQGSGADICKEALIEVRQLIKQYNIKYNEEVAFLICTVHDAIDSEVREDLAEEFAKEKAKIMVECGNKYVSKVSMEVDITITDFWFK